MISPAKRVLAMNQEAITLLGHDARGAHYTTILRQPSVAEAIEAGLRDAKARVVRMPLRAQDRVETYVLDVAPLAMAASPGLLVTFQDVSDAEGLGQMRRDFVANVSHELRTPLTALMGFIETLQGPAQDDARAREKFLGMMATEADRMNRLVLDLLSLSRVESEERLRPGARVDFADVIRESVETVSHATKKAGTAVTLALPEGKVWVDGDRDQLMQVVRNLAENAVKYGGGEVTISLALPEREAALRGPAAVLDVRDNGEGIEAHHVPRLTERFYRIDTHRSREQGGTGLGLAIVKHIVNRHRGRLRISSVRGEGSVFSVVLPRT
ncbi:MAG: ATP-binding protein [Pseudomonadota bacterium]